MPRGLNKKETLVLDIIDNKEYPFKSRIEASKFTGIEKRYISTYFKTDYIFAGRYKFRDLSKKK